MLDQMMILAADQSTKAFQALDVVSHNVGNYGTWGYKVQRFDQYFRPDGNADIVKRTDYTPGQLFLTKRELDIGIDGPGFIQVTRRNGATAYTRNGSFAKNAEGFLVTAHGDLVGAGIQIPPRYHQLKIDKDGTVQLIDKAGDTPKDLGRIPLVNFANPEGLKSIGDNLVVATSESGEAVKVENHAQIQQGRLEQSNVNIHAVVEEVLRLNGGVLTNLRVIKVVDELYREAVQLRQ